MLSRLRNEIYGGEQAEFAAAGSQEDAARRLALGTRRWSLRAAVVGRVSMDRVVLRHHRPFLNDSFAPVFRGCFTAECGQTLLRGRFQLHPSVQALTTVWFGFIAIFCVVFPIAGASVAAKQGDPWWLGVLTGLAFTPFVFLLGFVGFGFIRFCKWSSRGDVITIRRHITALVQDAQLPRDPAAAAIRPDGEYTGRSNVVLGQAGDHSSQPSAPEIKPLSRSHEQ